MNARTLFDAYAHMDKKQQREFDQHYKEFKQFKTNLNLIADAMTKHPDKAGEILKALSKKTPSNEETKTHRARRPHQHPGRHGSDL